MKYRIFSAKITSIHRVILSFCIVVLAMLSCTISPFAAHADNSSGNIDPSQRGSVTVHKYAQPNINTDLPNDGSQLGADQLADLTAIPDVTFSIKKVPGVDLTTESGWNAVTSTYSGDDAVNHAIEATKDVAAQSETTDASGMASFTDLDLGVYLIQETSAPANVTPSQPLVVTVPLPGSDNDGSWLYNIHLYPKNVVSSITKQVEQGTTSDDPVIWTIESSIPGGKSTDIYRIVDTLDARLALVSSAVAITGSSGVTISSPDDYTVTSVPGAGGEGNTVTIEFTELGRYKLFEAIAADAKSSVRTVLTTKVTDLGTDGMIPNVATLFPNSSTTIVSNKPEAVFGNVTIKKVAASDQRTLTGARFQIFPSLADAQTLKHPLSINGKSVWESDSQGLLTISGLAYGNYWIREVTAPDGFVVSGDTHMVTVNSFDTSVDYTISNTAERVTNPPTTAWGTGGWYSGPLARTGSGIAAFVVLLAVSGVLGTALLRRKFSSSAYLGGEER
ncbi:MAG: SpaH/EbpB family LPXTG-anchored major pilin [Bifidobacterium aquikefiri]|uniref:Fimbrial isopeptide formation D2 domain-containing protein n=1 Tax=Bifidobacterium aquikefiri TaxID=1653207 RepID=A0A261GAT5_9BIFI|nr:SpaH/EbpB family LPXTG-anchored major pilin [Bifidobacterium aquikefiri]OZG68520.1 fimbrial isopeptide formation D2 domain-containing protein [Bifidobacterium aquikefiri]